MPGGDDLPGGFDAFLRDWERLRDLRFYVPQRLYEANAQARLGSVRSGLIHRAEDLPWFPGNRNDFLRARYASSTDAELRAIFDLEEELRVLDVTPEQQQAIQDDDPEARAWFAGAPGARLAGNRFDDAADTLAFVDALYAAGARRVVIAAESICEHPVDPTPTADAIRVGLPDGVEERRAVLKIVNREVREEGGKPYRDRGQPSVFLWWD